MLSPFVRFNKFTICALSRIILINAAGHAARGPGLLEQRPSIAFCFDLLLSLGPPRCIRQREVSAGFGPQLVLPSRTLAGLSSQRLFCLALRPVHGLSRLERESPP